ncbi:MAG TPA: RNA-binding protein [Firmicutes bacterium]|jgi:RNA-binding protein YlmH|nr:RNA-binding protein [Bacillota bacterium]HAA34452.1 RNA-binding protein [Bacillota bacterium]
MLKERQSFNYPLPTEKKWAARFQSLLEKVEELNVEQWTPFVDPRQQQIARDLLHRFPGIQCSFFGGYPEAERVRIGLRPLSLPGGIEGEAVGCLSVRGNYPEGVLTHRDFLGALMGLGIKREMVGDIIYRGGEKAFIFLVKDLLPFVKANLQSAGRYALEVEEIEPEALTSEFAPRRVKEIRGTVASMRLDAVAGLGFGISRSKIAPLIKGEQVKVNYQLVKQPSRPVKEGDVISMAGRGRIEVVEKKGESRKGRTHLLLFRII